MIRVAVALADAARAAALRRALARADDLLLLADGAPAADVLVTDGHVPPRGPAVLLHDGVVAPPAVLPAVGFATLPLDASIDDLALAIRAAARGFHLRPAAERDGDAPAAGELTPRELAVVRTLAEGLDNRGIARALGISDHTVKHHLAAIYQKLGVRGRTETVREAIRRGWVEV